MKSLFLSIISIAVHILPNFVKRGLYRLGPVSKIIRKVLNHFSPSGLTTMVIAGGDLVGLRMNLDMKVEKDYWLGTYELGLQEMIREKVEDDWVAYDVGANIGYISLLLAKAVGENGRVFAFEALPDNLVRLEKNLRLNQIGAMVKIISAAVTNISNQVQFLIGPSGAMGKVKGSAGRSDIHNKTIEIKGISLDDFIFREGNPPPDVIKMDIEGGEVLAMEGMKKLLVEVRPLILMELHGPEASRKAWDTLTGAGYRICRMETELPRVRSWDALDWKAYLVAVP
jgi:FkbM family methyltransferase